MAAIGEALRQRWQQIAPGQPLNWVLQARLPAGPADTQPMAGAVPQPHVVTERGARYGVHVLRGQNHGLFPAMAAGRDGVRRTVATHPEPARMRVLNLFACTCAFSVVARLAGAVHDDHAAQPGAPAHCPG